MSLGDANDPAWSGYEVRLVTCPCCDGAGEWDEGPLPASSGATEPEYRQVICPQCEGSGKTFVKTEPRTLDDMDEEGVW